MFSGMLHSGVRRNTLPTVEPVSAENVWYYAIVEDKDDLQVNWDLGLAF
jgi:hypothetical protein